MNQYSEHSSHIKGEHYNGKLKFLFLGLIVNHYKFIMNVAITLIVHHFSGGNFRIKNELLLGLTKSLLD